MFSITISADTETALRSQVLGLASTMGGSVPAAPKTEAAPVGKSATNTKGGDAKPRPAQSAATDGEMTESEAIRVAAGAAIVVPPKKVKKAETAKPVEQLPAEDDEAADAVVEAQDEEEIEGSAEVEEVADEDSDEPGTGYTLDDVRQILTETREAMPNRPNALKEILGDRKLSAIQPMEYAALVGAAREYVAKHGKKKSK